MVSKAKTLYFIPHKLLQYCDKLNFKVLFFQSDNALMYNLYCGYHISRISTCDNFTIQIFLSTLSALFTPALIGVIASLLA